MGVTPSRALLFVMIASLVLAMLSLMQWWHLGGQGVVGIKGTNAGLTREGDGNAAIGAALVLFALAYFGAATGFSRTLAGIGICLVASLMFALLARDIIHPPRSPLGFIPDIVGYHATIWLYLAAAVSLAIDFAGALIIQRRPASTTRRFVREGTF